MSAEFRYAKPEDLQAIVQTYNSTIPSRMVTADLEPVTVESRQHWFNAHSPDKRPVWIISFKGRYAGWMSFSSFYGRPAYNGTAELSIYLETDLRGKGLGREALNKALSEARSLRIENVLGFIFGHNKPSLDLFYKAGFERWGCLPGVADMAGEKRDLLILGKKL